MDEAALLASQLGDLEDELRLCEKQIFDMETQYITESEHGNIIRGWDGFMDRFPSYFFHVFISSHMSLLQCSKPKKDSSIRKTKAADAERMFSWSSVTHANIIEQSPTSKDAAHDG